MKIKINFMKIFLFLFVSLFFINLVSPVALAVTQDDLTSILKGMPYYDGSDGCASGSSSSSGSGNNTASATPTNDVASFVDKYGQAAFNIGKQYGIPYEVILAQAIVESGYARSTLASQYFNFFGIKADPSWTGPTVTMSTQESVNGQTITIQAAFRAYPNAQAGFEGYGLFITKNSRYANALKPPANHDPYKYITEIKNAGYATAPDYVNTIWSVAQGVINYIASKNPPLFPPSSQVTYDNSPPAATTYTATGADSSCGSGSSTGGGGLANVVSIAQQEMALNPAPYGNASARDCNANMLKYTNGVCEAWCASFVSWVYKQAGIPFTGGDAGGWLHAGAAELQQYFKAKEVYFAAGAQSPAPGDVVFWVGADGSVSNPGHVSIVTAVNGNTFDDIGGNEQSKILASKGFKNIAGDQGLIGFGRIKN